MFTGIVEETGSVVRAEATPDGFVIRVRAERSIEGAQPGDSIAVNGTCIARRTWDGSSEPEVQADPLEAQMPCSLSW